MDEPRRTLATPEELAAVDELVRLLEQYQSYLLAGYAFADASRAQASNASGTARPALERLLPGAPQVLSRLDEALRTPATDEDRRIALQAVDGSVRDLRALIAGERWRKAAGETPVTVVPTSPPLESSPSSDGSAFAGTPESKVGTWAGAVASVAMLILAFATELFDLGSNRALSAVEPIVSAVSTGIVGNLIYQQGLRQAVRRRLGTMLFCSALIVITAPQALQSGRALVGLDRTASAIGQPIPSAAPGPQKPANDGATPSGSPGGATSAERGPIPPPAPEMSAPEGRSTFSVQAGPPALEESRGAGGSSTPSGRGTKASVGAPVSPPAARTQTAEVALRCKSLNERASLGETLTREEREFLVERCRN